MAITVNGQILRNLPEQVSKNTEDILELQNTNNNYGIRITALEQNAIALATFEDCSFTGTSSFAGPLVSSDGFTFDGNGSVGGNLSVGGDFAATGSTTFSGTVTASGNENIGGNLAVVGNITGGSIIENMIGYAASLNIPEDVVLTNIYTGVCKNGNKLTFVFAFNITKNTSGAIEPALIDFQVPDSIFAKLYPTTIGVITNMLDAKTIQAFSGEWSSVNMPVELLKTTNRCRLYAQLSNLAQGTTYYARYEATFLLSDSLI